MRYLTQEEARKRVETSCYSKSAKSDERPGLPETARFISRDPDGGDKDDPLNQNLYIYCNSDPVNNVDPDGEWFIAAAWMAYDGYMAYRSGKARDTLAGGWQGTLLTTLPLVELGK